MKKYFLLIVLPVFLVACLGDNRMKNAAVADAEKMGIAFKNRQLEKYLDAMAHFVFANDAEREDMKKSIQSELAFLDDRKVRIVKVQTAIHGDVYLNDGYYQCMIKQVFSHQNNYTTYGANAYLLAVSKDGENWKFAEVTNINEKLVKTVFPELSPELKFNNKDK